MSLWSVPVIAPTFISCKYALEDKGCQLQCYLCLLVSWKRELLRSPIVQEVQAAPEHSASLALIKPGGSSEVSSSSEAGRGAANEDRHSEEGPDTPPLATPRDPWEVAKQDLAVIDAAEVDGRVSLLCK